MASYKITETRRQRTTRTGFGASNNRSTLGYWIPLALTVTAATVGIAAWIWSERGSEDDESSSEEQDPNAVRPPGYGNMSGGLPPGPGPGGYQGPPHPEWQGGQPPAVGGFQGGPPPPGMQGGFQDSRDVQSRSTAIETTEESTLVSRMSNALGIQRAPSPGQAYNWASRNISAGVAAAGAAVGGAITSFSGETKEGFDEHERWSEEADQQRGSRNIEGQPQLKRRGTAEEFYSGSVSLPRSTSLPFNKRRTVALVVSSLQNGSSGDETDIDGHSSILAHLPEYINQDTTRIFVLIYAPTLETHPLSPLATGGRSQPSQSMASSFSNISAAEAMTPGSFDQQHDPERSDGILSNIDPKPIDETTTSLYKSLHNHALSLVDKDTMIMPFTSPQGHKHIIKSLQPEIVYMQESMCGSEGEIVSELSGWVRTCVVVIGDEGGTGGLVDTDDEAESRRSRKSGSGGSAWWKREDRTGLGRGVEVVEALKIGEDWRRRVNAED